MRRGCMTSDGCVSKSYTSLLTAPVATLSSSRRRHPAKEVPRAQRSKYELALRWRAHVVQQSVACVRYYVFRTLRDHKFSFLFFFFYFHACCALGALSMAMMPLVRQACAAIRSFRSPSSI
mmetsp:Transcript_14963/g.40124  ORF Transcript_14963/g.40124 Transcript_14963/m.40124 type:complete len:121 (+) Transcript_14963:765-1127(+)